jgi:hypothetical protein
MADPPVTIEILLPQDEWLDWNRAAVRAKSDLPNWVRMVVNTAQTPRDVPRRRRAPRETPEPLHWEDEMAYERRCGYCGVLFDYDVTRRKRYCSDVCRVRAWRVRKRRDTSV